MKNLLIFFAAFYICVLNGQPVSISFKNKSYAGDTVLIKTTVDYITGIDTILVRDVVDAEGNFSCRMNLDKCRKLILPLYFFKGVLYAEPGKDYVLTLPRKTPIPVHAEISPFFEPMLFYAYLPEKQPRELNNLIFEFDSVYEDYISRNSSVLLFESFHSKVDTFINALQEKYGKTGNAYFSTYLASKIALLNYFSRKRDLYYVINFYLNSLPVSTVNDGYMDLFNNLFRDFFRFYSFRKEGATLYDDIVKAKSPHAIRQTLYMNPVFNNDTICELVILKGLHDAFFPGDPNMKRDYPHTQLYLTLDSVRTINRYSFTDETVTNIVNKAFTRYKPVEYGNLSLINCNKETFKLSSLKGQYVYFAFYDTRNYTCQKELKLFVKMASKHEKDVRFVLIITNPPEEDFLAFCKKYNHTFTVLYAGPGNELLTRFGVTVFPHYMLFDPYGFVILTAAPAPSENFEPKMYRLLE
jgi:peroxiredoxin